MAAGQTPGAGQASAAKPPEGDEHAPEAVTEAAQSPDAAKRLTENEEQEALDFLLGASGPLPFKLPVTIYTDRGDRKIGWTIRQLDGKRILALEDEHTDDQTGKVDDLALNAAIVAEATIFPDVASEKFRTPPPVDGRTFAPDAAPTDALLRIFRFQSGLLTGIAAQVRSISGWSVDRVGSAQRVLVDAAGNS